MGKMFLVNLIVIIAISIGVGYCSNSTKTQKTNVNKEIQKTNANKEIQKTNANKEITMKKPSISTEVMTQAKYKTTCGQCHATPDPKKYTKDQWIKHTKRMKMYSKISEEDIQKSINLWDNK